MNEEEQLSLATDLDATTKEERLDGRKKALFPFFQWKSFFLFIGILCGICFQWMYTSEIFYVPSDISLSRMQFAHAKENYMRKREYWDMQLRREESQMKSSFVEYAKDVSPEVWISYLVNVLHISPKDLDGVTLYPKEEGSVYSLVLSKHEPGVWPFVIVLSIELRLMDDSEVVVTRIRRGARDIARGLSWAYFGKELDWLQSRIRVT